MPASPGDGGREGDPTLNLEALAKCQQDHSACPSGAKIVVSSLFLDITGLIPSSLKSVKDVRGSLANRSWPIHSIKSL